MKINAGTIHVGFDMYFEGKKSWTHRLGFYSVFYVEKKSEISDEHVLFHSQLCAWWLMSSESSVCEIDYE